MVGDEKWMISPRAVVPIVLDEVRKYQRVDDMIDIGCGGAYWPQAFNENGIEHTAGVDRLKAAELFFQPTEYYSRDMDASRYHAVDFGNRFDLAICLEHAEHLKPSSAGGLIALLTELSDVVFFSAATPGQGGDGHINERPHDYWHTLFEAFGFSWHDVIRPRTKNMKEVLWWYQRNMFLYVRDTLKKRD